MNKTENINEDTIWMNYMRLFERFATFTKERYIKAHTNNTMPISTDDIKELKN